MNRKMILLVSTLIFIFSIGFAQNLQVETILNLNASGGVTFGPDGNVYVSDFGPALGTPSSNTSVFKVAYGTWDISVFATGFTGASGSRFDSQGNFYQSNPSGGRVSKRTPSGVVDYNWATTGISGPIGITSDGEDNLFVCNCGNNTIRIITPDGSSFPYAASGLFNCPNGIAIDPSGNLYVSNFSDGNILKVDPDGVVTLFLTLPMYPPAGVGNGHLTFSNGFLFAAAIGTGQIYKISLAGNVELIAGISQGFSNIDGPALQATFSKPNGIAASYTGDTMWVNCSVPTWVSNNNALHPGLLRMITGVCSLPDVNCPLLPLSIELISFDAIPNSNNVMLNWNTASEVNNAGFEIERSEDGKLFEKINWVAGQGSTLEFMEYHYEDKGLQMGNSYYYRLKQIDYDGQFEYSKVIFVTLQEESENMGEFFPNPAVEGKVNIDFFAEEEGTWDYLVYGSNGQELTRESLMIVEGSNALIFNFSTLGKGVFFVKFVNGRKAIYRKLIIK